MHIILTDRIPLYPSTGPFTLDPSPCSYLAILCSVHPQVFSSTNFRKFRKGPQSVNGNSWWKRVQLLETRRQRITVDQSDRDNQQDLKTSAEHIQPTIDIATKILAAYAHIVYIRWSRVCASLTLRKRVWEGVLNCTLGKMFAFKVHVFNQVN